MVLISLLFGSYNVVIPHCMICTADTKTEWELRQVFCSSACFHMLLHAKMLIFNLFNLYLYMEQKVSTYILWQCNAMKTF